MMHRSRLRASASQPHAAQTRPDRARSRSVVVAFLLVGWMLAIAARLIYLQAIDDDRYRARAQQQQQTRFETAAMRGQVVDRTGRELARTVSVSSFFADPREVENTADAARVVASALGIDRNQLAEKIQTAKANNKRFVWLARKVEPDKSDNLRALNVKGVYETSEPKRFYPNGTLASHIVGFVGSDDEGLGGVERFFNASLTGEVADGQVERDAKRHSFDSTIVEAKPGQSVVLTIDNVVQYRTEQVLEEAVARSHAKSGTAVAIDPRTGEILALANAPTFDPNEAARLPAERLRNDALQNIYEPGSTFKIVAFSAALEEGLVRPDEKIDCQMGAINVRGRIVHDHSAFGTLTLTEALAKSSNVAAIKLGLRVGDEKMYEYIRRFGFGARTGVELPGETGGILRPLARWQPGSMGSIAIGQEIGITPVQIAAAFAAIANDGVRIQPHLVREVRDARGETINRVEPEAHRVISAETAARLRGMLESVTVNGTAKLARINGYSAAGKTGTAQKIDPKTKTYSLTKHVASFVGFAPIENPAVVIAVVIDEPAGAYHGGDVAAPIFSRIAESILPYLDVMPDQELLPTDANGVQLARRTASGADDAAAMRRNSLNDEAQMARRMEIEREAEQRRATLPRDATFRDGVDRVVYATASDRAMLMPDLRGQSVRDAARICAQLGLQLEASGNGGRAAKQSPAAGASIEAGQTVRVEFARSD